MIFDNAIIFIVLGAILIVNFKSLFLKFLLLIYWYPLITMYLFCIEYPLWGSIEFIGRPAHEVYAKEAFEIAVIGYFILIIVLWRIRNLKFKFERIEFSESYRTFIAIVLVAISILAYPKAFGIGEGRWNLIAGPWLVASIALNVVLLISLKSIKSLASIIQILLSVVLLVGGERVNTLVVFLLFFMLDSDELTSIVREKKLTFYSLLLGGIGVLMAIGSHYWREGEEVNSLILLQNIISSSTVSDVTHIYFSSFGYLKENGVNLAPVINELASIFSIPKYGGTGENVASNFTEILREYMYNNGGGLFYTEGILIFGKYGVLIYSVIYGYLVRFLFVFSRRNWIVTTIMLAFLVLQLRIQWYGFMYVYMPIWIALVAIKFFSLFKVQEDEYDAIEVVETEFLDN